MNIPGKAFDAAMDAAIRTMSAHTDVGEAQDIGIAAIRAAAPFIAAQALRDALDEVDTMRSGPAAAPYVSATKAVLRSIADQWDDQ